MKINPLLKNYSYISCGSNKKQTLSQAADNHIQTSLYNQKGVNVPFCGLAKGIDIFEEECISFLRQVRENRFRKFDENDIKEMLTSLRKEKTVENKKNILKEVFELEDEELNLPAKQYLKKALNLIAGRNEEERFALLEFAQHEIKYATQPLEAFSKLPSEKQNKLIKILTKIDSVNEPVFFKTKDKNITITESLYDLFRTLVYAEDDLTKLKTTDIAKYKINTYHLLKNDMKYFDNIDGYANEQSKLKVIDVTKAIYEYFLENIM